MKQKPAAATFFDGDDRVLATAIEKGDVEAVRKAASAVELSAPRRHDMTFLFFAMIHEQNAAVAELIRAGADPAIAVPGLGSPLGTATRAKDTRLLTVLLDAGVDPNAKDASGLPILFAATEGPTTAAIKLLHDRGANLDVTDSLEAAPVYRALTRRKFDHVEYLIQAGANVHFSTVNGVTMSNAVERQLGLAKPDSKLAEHLAKIKGLLEHRGLSFPSDPPEVVRQKRKEAGLKVAE